MVRPASYVASAMLALVFCFQCALILGAPFGQFTQGGAVSGALPASGRILAAVSALIVVIFWVGISGRAGWGPWKHRRRGPAVITWIAVGYSAIGLVVNAASPSVAERVVWVPAIAVLLASSLTVALGTRRPKAK